MCLFLQNAFYCFKDSVWDLSVFEYFIEDFEFLGFWIFFGEDKAPCWFTADESKLIGQISNNAHL